MVYKKELRKKVPQGYAGKVSKRSIISLLFGRTPRGYKGIGEEERTKRTPGGRKIGFLFFMLLACV